MDDAAGPGSTLTESEWVPLLAEAIDGEQLALAFQPIVDIARGTVVGYEALSRFPAHLDIGPEAWFEAARAHGRGGELEATAIKLALSCRADLPPNCFLAINVEPRSLADPLVQDAFRTGGDLNGIVIELTEHLPFDPALVDPPLSELREAGALIALDDAGAGHSGLRRILELRPAFLKLDRSLVEGIHRDEVKSALVEMLGVFANRIDAWLIAEGIEELADLRRIAQLGVPLAQGYGLSRPGPPWAPVSASALGELRSVFRDPSDPTLRTLVEPGTFTTQRALSKPHADLPSSAHLTVVLDDNRRPIGLADVDSAPTAELLPVLRTNVDTGIDELARRVVTRRDNRWSDPVAIIDSSGRYIGVITIPRLIGALADPLPH